MTLDITHPNNYNVTKQLCFLYIIERGNEN